MSKIALDLLRGSIPGRSYFSLQSKNWEPPLIDGMSTPARVGKPEAIILVAPPYHGRGQDSNERPRWKVLNFLPVTLISEASNRHI